MDRVNLRLTHPTLYRSAIVFAAISIGLGLNFLFTKPTFNAFGIDKHIVGVIFLCLGTAKLAAITAIRRLKYIRITMVANSTFMTFWGMGTATTYFTGQTSLQLFVLYIGLALLQMFLLFEPFINPITGHRDGGPLPNLSIKDYLPEHNNSDSGGGGGDGD